MNLKYRFNVLFLLVIFTFLTAPVFAATVDIRLTWQDNSNNEEHFVIEHRTGNGSFTQIAQTAANASSYDTQIDNSVTNYYRVYAKNSAGSSGYSNVALFTIPGDVDGSGTVNLSDAIVGLQVMDSISYQGKIHIESDVNNDDKVGLPESINALRKVAE